MVTAQSLPDGPGYSLDRCHKRGGNQRRLRDRNADGVEQIDLNKAIGLSSR